MALGLCSWRCVCVAHACFPPVDAIRKDLHKHPCEAELTEVAMAKNDIVDMLDHLDEWSSPQVPDVGMVNKFDGCLIQAQPLGLVCVLGAWNYPIQLTFVPLVGALAAGNCVVLKPSEMAPHTAQLCVLGSACGFFVCTRARRCQAVCPTECCL